MRYFLNFKIVITSQNILCKLLKFYENHDILILKRKNGEIKMYKKRINEIFKNTDCDLLFISAQPEIFYLSGFTGDDSYLVISKDKRYIVTDSRYFIQALSEAKDYEMINIAEKPVSHVIKSENAQKVGYLDKSMTCFYFNNLKLKLDSVEFVPISETIAKIRMIKTDEEIENIRIAAKIADEGFSHILKFIKEGTKELDLALELEFFMRKKGASGLSFETICASGARSAMPHGAASNKKIEAGDFITFDFGCVYRGYASDMTRTVVLGKASEKQKEIYETVLKAQKAALSVIKSGEKTKDVDKIARGIIKNAGYGENFGHGLGHSLGLLVHEFPSCSPKSDAVLKENMLMTVEPGIYIENFGGVRIEDLVVVKNDGYENLTVSEKELIEI